MGQARVRWMRACLFAGVGVDRGGWGRVGRGAVLSGLGSASGWRPEPLTSRASGGGTLSLSDSRLTGVRGRRTLIRPATVGLYCFTDEAGVAGRHGSCKGRPGRDLWQRAAAPPLSVPPDAPSGRSGRWATRTGYRPNLSNSLQLSVKAVAGSTGGPRRRHRCFMMVKSEFNAPDQLQRFIEYGRQHLCGVPPLLRL
jgi:hypothetical protein